MSLPRPEDLDVEAGTEEERAEAIAVAVRVAELLAGRAILFRDRTQEILLGGTEPCALLSYFPVDHLTIDGVSSPRGFWVEEGTGVLGAYPGVPAASYRVDFRVGCESEIPVILEVLIQAIAEHQLGGGPGATEILEVSASAAAMTDLAAADREQFREKVV